MAESEVELLPRLPPPSPLDFCDTSPGGLPISSTTIPVAGRLDGNGGRTEGRTNDSPSPSPPPGAVECGGMMGPGDGLRAVMWPPEEEVDEEEEAEEAVVPVEEVVDGAAGVSGGRWRSAGECPAAGVRRAARRLEGHPRCCSALLPRRRGTLMGMAGAAAPPAAPLPLLLTLL